MRPRPILWESHVVAICFRTGARLCYYTAVVVYGSPTRRGSMFRFIGTTISVWT